MWRITKTGIRTTLIAHLQHHWQAAGRVPLQRQRDINRMFVDFHAAKIFILLKLARGEDRGIDAYAICICELKREFTTIKVITIRDLPMGGDMLPILDIGCKHKGLVSG